MGKNKINKRVILDNCKIGFGTYIGENSKFYKSDIGKYCSIGANVKIIVGKHPTEKFVSTHPSFFSLKRQAGFTYVEKNFFHEVIDKDLNYSVFIGNDVWIGEDVKILEGIRIGDGAIIGTGAVVTKNIESYSINVGIPAKVIKYRFEKKEIQFLLDFEWWNRDEIWIKKNIMKFTDVKKFLKES